MNSAELNAQAHALADGERYQVRGLENTGKCIPYIGWYWRHVDFTVPVRLGFCPPHADAWLIGEHRGWAGFMVTNKWGYEERVCSPSDSEQIVALLQVAVSDPSSERLQALFDHIQAAWERSSRAVRL